MIIHGKYTDATIFTHCIEPSAAEQIRTLCDHPASQGSRIRIMPDVHAGKGCTIGTTMTVTDRVIPSIVGVDIGCGMYTVRLHETDIDLPRLDAAVHAIPSGRSIWEGRKETFDTARLRCGRELQDTRRLQRSLGTLGGGNHFIEVDRDSHGTLYLVIHSGSRSLGHQVATYYQALASLLHEGYDTYLRARADLIAQYKAEGRRSEIHDALRKLTHTPLPRTLPPELCFVSGSYLDDYLHDVALCQDFARRNREIIAGIILESVGCHGTDAFHTVHNYIDTDSMILRKGAISARAGETVLIPINMRDGSLLARGRGNPDWNFSAPHGAGRRMSRSAARDALSLEDYREAMRGIYTTSVSAETLDEAPMAYKSMEDILENTSPAAEVLDILKPLYNFKAPN